MAIDSGMEKHVGNDYPYWAVNYQDNSSRIDLPNNSINQNYYKILELDWLSAA